MFEPNFPVLTLICKFCNTIKAPELFLLAKRCFFGCNYNDCSIFGKILARFLCFLCAHSIELRLLCYSQIFETIYFTFYLSYLLTSLSSYSNFNRFPPPFSCVFFSQWIVYPFFTFCFIDVSSTCALFESLSDILSTTVVINYSILICTKLKLIFLSSK